jgi:SAM-dependent methyltransferase
LVSEVLAHVIPFRVYRLVGSALLAPLDAVRSLTRKSASITPPLRKSFIYGDHYQVIGEEFLNHFVELGGLKPDDTVLDVGCGIGRMALPLTGYLSSKGQYWGFDIVDDGIEWCNQNISPRCPNFHFAKADVRNPVYNPDGGRAAHRYRFPYETGHFDFVFATSVFTHMLPGGVANYLSEISRVLRPGGRCLCTFFILGQQAMERVDLSASRHQFRHEGPGYVSVSKHEPEKAVAYDEPSLRATYDDCGLEIVEPVHYGAWSGRTGCRSGQDIIVAVNVRDAVQAI